MYTYRAFGLDIQSDFPIPQFTPSESSGGDVYVRFGKEPWRSVAPADDGPCIFASDTESEFAWDGVACFRVSNGREIEVVPHPEVDPALIRLPLVGVVFGALLQQRGLVVLHASSVLINGGAIAIAGPKGHGKSTLAAALYRLGHQVLGDDVAAVDLAGSPSMYPAFPSLNLWPHAAKSVGNDPERLHALRNGGIKRVLHVQKNFAHEPVPLKCVYLLDYGKELQIIEPEPGEAFKRLLPQCYAARYWSDVPGTAGRLLTACGSLIRQVPVKRLVRRDAVRDVFAAAMRVEEDASFLSKPERFDAVA